MLHDWVPWQQPATREPTQAARPIWCRVRAPGHSGRSQSFVRDRCGVGQGMGPNSCGLTTKKNWIVTQNAKMATWPYVGRVAHPSPHRLTCMHLPYVRYSLHRRHCSPPVRPRV